MPEIGQIAQGIAGVPNGYRFNGQGWMHPAPYAAQDALAKQAHGETVSPVAATEAFPWLAMELQRAQAELAQATSRVDALETFKAEVIRNVDSISRRQDKLEAEAKRREASAPTEHTHPEHDHGYHPLAKR